ncbi:MAG: hypothetical protein KDB23_02545 [Planctomycetales bacterium]|nr:hypothetical protein [Planctomycetales bacterium]
MTISNANPESAITNDSYNWQSPAANSQVAGQPLEQEADRLRVVASQIELFLFRQIERLEDEIAHCNAPVSQNSGSLEEGWSEFERARSKWEDEKNQERARLHEEAQRLLEAWGKIEHEQRELMKQRLPGKLSGSVPTAAPPTSTGDSSLSPISSTNRPADASGGTAARNQFQQLRREMLEHARQRRKP